MSNLFPTNYLATAPRLIVSIAYDPARCRNLSNVNNGSTIDVYRLVMAENQKWVFIPVTGGAANAYYIKNNMTTNSFPANVGGQLVTSTTPFVWSVTNYFNGYLIQDPVASLYWTMASSDTASLVTLTSATAPFALQTFGIAAA